MPPRCGGKSPTRGHFDGTQTFKKHKGLHYLPPLTDTHHLQSYKYHESGPRQITKNKSVPTRGQFYGAGAKNAVSKKNPQSGAPAPEILPPRRRPCPFPPAVLLAANLIFRTDDRQFFQRRSVIRRFCNGVAIDDSATGESCFLHWRSANCNSPLFSLCSAIDDSAIRRSTILPPANLDFCTGDRRIANRHFFLCVRRIAIRRSPPFSLLRRFTYRRSPLF